jgi:hypothetical protein
MWDVASVAARLVHMVHGRLSCGYDAATCCCLIFTCLLPVLCAPDACDLCSLSRLMGTDHAVRGRVVLAGNRLQLTNC